MPKHAKLSRPAIASCLIAMLCAVSTTSWPVQSSAQPATAEMQELAPINQQRADRLREDLRHMVALARDRVFPALVNIRVITARYYGGRERKGQATGSGTIISGEGHVLTNFHVVQNGKKFKCTLSNKKEVDAELVGEDPLTDLAILKIDLLGLDGQGFSVAKLGDSEELEIGDTVMAMGSPWALSRSVTLGIVSNTERILAGSDDDAGEMRFNRDQRTGIFNRWIQHDAAINPGNSGGPLVNLKGEVVGVNARGTFFGGDMGFAIPSNVAKRVAADLIEHRGVSRSWYGMSFKPIKKSGHKEGVLVNSVVENGPADQAGVKAGDVVMTIDGDPITVWFPEEVPPLLDRLANLRIGGQLSVTYKRGDETATAIIKSARLEKDRGDEAAFKAWGLVAIDITAKMARERRLENTDGVLIGSVRNGSPAMMAEPSLASGDIIHAIDGQPMLELQDLLDFYEALMDAEDLPDYLLVEFDRRGKSNLTLVKPKPDKDVDPPREVAKAWIGVAVQPVVKKLAKHLGDPELVGFRITRVYPRTLAADSDLKVGDVITKLNGERLKPRGKQDSGMFHRQVRRLHSGDEATITVRRADAENDIQVSLERTRITQQEARRDHNRDFELIVREVTFFDRDESRWDDSVKGVLITDAEAAGWARLAGMRPRDLIQRIDDQRITGLKSYRKAMEAVTESKSERVVFVVLRGSRTHFQYAEPEWSPAKDDSQDNEKEE